LQVRTEIWHKRGQHSFTQAFHTCLIINTLSAKECQTQTKKWVITVSASFMPVRDSQDMFLFPIPELSSEQFWPAADLWGQS